MTKVVIKGQFHASEGSETVGTSGDHSDLVVQTLDRSTGNLAASSEPVEKEFLVGAKHAGDSLHRFQSTSHRPPAPVVEEAARPMDASIAPKMLERLFQAPRPSRRQFACQKGVQFLAGSTSYPAATSEEFPPHLLEARGDGLSLQSRTLRAPNLIHGVIQVHHHVKAIHHMHRVSGHRGDDRQIGLPHVAADESKAGDNLRSEDRQPLAQRRLGSLLSNPEQAASARVDLVDDRQEIGGPFALAPVDLVDADGCDSHQFAVCQSPFDEPFDRAMHRFPTGMKDACRLAPRHPPRPRGQESHHRPAHRTLSVAPRHVFDDHPMLTAVHSAGRVAQEHGNLPEGNETPSSFRQSIVARTRLKTFRAFPASAGVRLDVDLDLRVAFAPHELHVSEHEPGKVLNQIQEGFNFELDGWTPWLGLTPDWTPNRTTGGQPSFLHSDFFWPPPRDPRPEDLPSEDSPHSRYTFVREVAVSDGGRAAAGRERSETHGRGTQRANGAPSEGAAATFDARFKR